MRVLVINAGSSSLKLRLLDDNDVLEQSADLPAGRDGLDTAALEHAIADWTGADAIGHRIVHGGNQFTGPVVVDDAVRKQLPDLVDLAAAA